MKKARVTCSIQSGQNALQERFEWYFSDSDPNISQYEAGYIKTAEMLCNPDTIVTLRVVSIGANNEEAATEVSMSIPAAPQDPLPPEAPVLGGLVIVEWVDV